MFSWAQIWLFNIPIPTFILILFTTRVNGRIFLKKKTILNSVQFECKTTVGIWEFFKKSKFLPEKCTYLSQICFIKIWTAYWSNWDTVKYWLSFFFWTRWQNKRQILECMHGLVHVTSSPKCFFYNNYFSHQFNHQNVSREKQLALSSGFCFYNNNNNKNRKKY